MATKIRPRFHCYNCKRDFNWPKEVQESRGEYWGIPCTETVWYCPYCGSEEFAEIEEDK